MAKKTEADKTTSKDKIKRDKSDVPQNFEKPDSDDDFKVAAKKAPHNKSIDGKPLDTNKDKYNEATRVGNDDGEEAIKKAREKFAKKKDEPAGIASAKAGSKSIKDSLDQTDPDRKSQVLPQMYDKFGMIMNILTSSSSGGQAQNQLQVLANQPNYQFKLDGDTKEMLTSAVAFALSDSVKRLGYDHVIEALELATTGYYTKDEAVKFEIKAEVVPLTFRFDLLSPDYQDVMTNAIMLMSALYQKYGQEKMPFLNPVPIRRPKTKKKPPNLIKDEKELSKYSILRFYPKSSLEEIEIDGETDISKLDSSNIEDSNFMRFDNSDLRITTDSIVLYNEPEGKDGLPFFVPNNFYYVVSSNTSGFKISNIPDSTPIYLMPTANSGAVFYVLETYSGYEEWLTLTGSTEYLARRIYSVPDFETPEELCIYRCQEGMQKDLYLPILSKRLTINFLATFLDKYTTILENDFMDFTLGLGTSAERDIIGEPFNPNQQNQNNGGGGGNNMSNMLGQILPQLQQLLKKSETSHLSSQESVLEKEKMKKLLKNVQQKKTENERMASFAESGVGGGIFSGLGGIGGLSSISNLSNLSGAGGFGNIMSGGDFGQMGGFANMGSIFGGGDLGGLFSAVKSFAKSSGTSSGGSTAAPPMTQTVQGQITYVINGATVDVGGVVTETYRNILKRGPDDAGYVYWTGVFTQEVSLYGYEEAYKRLQAYFKNSIEYKQKIIYDKLTHYVGIEGLL